MFEVGSCDMHVDYCSQVHYRNNISIGVTRLVVDLARFVLLGTSLFTRERPMTMLGIREIVHCLSNHSQSFPLMHKRPLV